MVEQFIACTKSKNFQASRGIDRIRAKIQEYSYNPPISRLEEEVAYWQDRIKEFDKIASKLVMLKKAQDDVMKQEEIYNSMKYVDVAILRQNRQKYTCTHKVDRRTCGGCRKPRAGCKPFHSYASLRALPKNKAFFMCYFHFPLSEAFRHFNV